MVILVMLAILAILAAKFRHFALENKPKFHEILKLELKSYLVTQTACFYLYLATP